jgi:hypothetical protein
VLIGFKSIVISTLAAVLAMSVVGCGAGASIEYASSKPTNVATFERAARDLGYSPREMKHVSGHPGISVDGVSERDARKLSCVSLRLGHDIHSPPEYLAKMKAACGE